MKSIYRLLKKKVYYPESGNDDCNIIDDSEKDDPTIKEALTDPNEEYKLIEAINAEMRNLEQRGTWTIVDKPENQSIITVEFDAL